MEACRTLGDGKAPARVGGRLVGLGKEVGCRSKDGPHTCRTQFVTCLDTLTRAKKNTTDGSRHDEMSRDEAFCRQSTGPELGVRSPAKSDGCLGGRC